MDSNTEKLITNIAVHAYIVMNLSKINPQDSISKKCIFCQNPVGENSVTSAHDKRCAWRNSREFVSGEYLD